MENTEFLSSAHLNAPVSFLLSARKVENAFLYKFNYIKMYLIKSIYI